MTKEEKRKLSAIIDYELTKVLNNNTRTQEEYNYALHYALHLITITLSLMEIKNKKI